MTSCGVFPSGIFPIKLLSILFPPFLYTCVSRVKFGNGGCNGRVALGVTYELRKSYNIDALVGLPCSVGMSATSF